jgi:Tol biopolymer transport system component
MPKAGCAGVLTISTKPGLCRILCGKVGGRILDLSADGNFVALRPDTKTFGNSVLRIISLQDNTARSLERKNEIIYQFTWATDNQHLFLVVSSGPANALIRVDLKGNSQILSKVAISEPGLINPAPSPDGRHLAYSLNSWEANAVLLENF